MIRQGHEWFIAQINDCIGRCEKRHQQVFTCFLALAQQEIVKKMVGNRLFLIFDGGYDNAERKIAVLSQYEQEPDGYVCVLRADYDNRFGKKLSHKDLLGVLMHAGIERDQIGDLIVQEDRLYIFCVPAMSDYICANVSMIGRHPVQFYEVDRVEETLRVEREQFTINVIALRLDAIVAALAHCSRAKAKMLLKQGMVKVNDVVLDENIQLCNNDFVSIRKVGRFRLIEEVNKTRKDRLVLRFEKYI